MKLEMTIFDNRHSIIYDISQVASDIKITTQMEGQPGKCTFELVKTDGIAFWEGATVSVTVDGHPMFKGFVFTKQRKKEVNLITITCYDQLRYLKNKDTFVFQGLTSDQIFVKVCDKFVLKHKVVDASRYICAPRSNDNKSLHDMIQTAIDDTLVNTNKWYVVRDNFGVLEHVNITSLKSDIVIGDFQSLLDFDYTTSIDSDVYNQIKLYKDNKKSGKRETYIVNDTINGGKNLKEWGILQLHESVDESLTLPQIEVKARGLLKLYNNVKKDLKLEAIGDPTITAGSIITCRIGDLGDMGLNNYLVVTTCSHSLSNDLHTMSLTVEVVI